MVSDIQGSWKGELILYVEFEGRVRYLNRYMNRQKFEIDEMIKQDRKDNLGKYQDREKNFIF